METELRFSQEEIEALENVFSGHGPMPSTRDFFGPFLKLFENSTHEAFSMRYQAAMSGAMRWPWSQEAAISINVKVRIK